MSRYGLGLMVVMVMALALLLAACGGDDDDAGEAPVTATASETNGETVEPTPTEAAADGEEDDGVLIDGYIGTATMEDDGTIVLRLRAELPSGGVGEGVLEYPPDDPQYQEILDHIGDINPGETVDVLPFPE